ncbi:DNA mismatch repair protein MutS [Halobacterium hubeiense]|uniref:DNA mismatch repair protein MutS n=2 Tax=Halobacterium TaxID=2239 RepID=A0A0U5H295_9EURY|nr:DNA mismatch repair protein [Halobacterium hubeiense]CQH47787.1 DNA mismatch repair protein MutS [Halobacterium hubeiense]
MRLEEFWGVGPKTADKLETELGVPDAIDAIESANVRALVDAGISRGRATRILRRANGGEGMDALATDDARAVYKELVALAADYAVTPGAADRIRVRTPLTDRDAMRERLDDVEAARETWARLDGETQQAVLDTFDAHDDAGDTQRAAVETALALQDAVSEDSGVFASVTTLDRDALEDAAEALRYLTGDGVAAGADAKLDRLRERAGDLERLERDTFDVLEDVRSQGVEGTDEFREAFVQYVASEAGVEPRRVRSAMAADAADAADFVSTTLRALADDVREDEQDREDEVAADLRGAISTAREEVDAAVTAVSDLAVDVSLARFAEAHDLTRPEFVDADAIAVENARNLSLAAEAGDVQPVTYAVGDHSLDPPNGDRVAVLTGANSGGKTTLLETLCQVAVLAAMGLPVPADRAELGPVDAIVFHRRHASFNAGVLEATLNSVVPPLAEGDRTLMLVDEFEAITEPGSAADLLHGLVTLTVDEQALGVFVTHLAEDLEPLPDVARTDGIFAEGLSQDLDLLVDYQPRFGTVGKSTPEFIVSRLVADAGDRAERAGYETLARAVGEEAVQRTLADAEWSE